MCGAGGRERATEQGGWGAQNLEGAKCKLLTSEGFLYLLRGLRVVGSQKDLPSKHWELGWLE